MSQSVIFGFTCHHICVHVCLFYSLECIDLPNKSAENPTDLSSNKNHANNSILETVDPGADYP